MLNLEEIVLTGTESLGLEDVASLVDYFGEVFVVGYVQGFVDDLQVVDHSRRFFSCVCANQQFRLTVLYPIGQLMRRKPSEDDDMGSPDPGAGMNRH